MNEMKHTYGENYHILDNPFLSSLLALLCAQSTEQPLITDLIKLLYQGLIAHVISQEFPKKKVTLKTRMYQEHPEALLSEKIIDFNTKVITVNLARAGILPSQLCYEFLNHLFKPKNVRQDHIYINRMVDENNRVTGSAISGYKIGGSIDNAIVLYPDPMGATGGSICATLDLYKKKVHGKVQKFIALHLIITPEYLKRVHEKHPDLIVYGLRLDRGLSSQKVLKSIPGTYWKEEKGLNTKQYIVPGAGGLGELLNNSFV
ncbi:MAG: uracil phosphoribosyltransferase [Deltaproteobacteria bacterium]|nr:uracil phosphoribosyltransferase [Deltaproteobacteria bacterium]